MITSLFHRVVQYSRPSYDAFRHLSYSHRIPSLALHNCSSRSDFYLQKHQSQFPYHPEQLYSAKLSLHQFCSRSKGPYQLSMDLPRRIETSRELRERAHRLCREHLGGIWTKISSEQMSFTPVSGGMSNLLYCCALPESTKAPDGEPSQVLLRLYGDQSRTCDMSLQVQIFELLSSRELGPKLYGNFDEGRLEEFLPATSLTSDELRNSDISAVIARKLAVVHSLDVPNLNKQDSWISERLREWPEYIETQKKTPLIETGKPLSKTTLQIAEKLLAIDYENEIKFVHQIVDGIRSPIVFSHNDLHQGNILLVKPTKRRPVLEQRVILIDFEYCSYNYRAYDIANHFCEWCFEYDTEEYPHFAVFESRYPSIETQREFIRNYLDQQSQMSLSKSAHQINGKLVPNGHHNSRTRSNGHSILHDNNNLLENGNGAMYLESVPKGYEAPKLTSVNDLEVDKILKEVRVFSMVANLVWTLWCIKCAYTSNIKFGFWDHAWSRWQLYQAMKQSYLASRAQRGSLVKNVKSNIPSIRAQAIDIEARR